MHVHPILSDYIIRHNFEFEDRISKPLDLNKYDPLFKNQISLI
jgi:hypothetical protein